VNGSSARQAKKGKAECGDGSGGKTDGCYRWKARPHALALWQAV
jgi:hypothetical protein